MALGGDIALKNLKFTAASSGYTISGKTLNFGVDGTITNAVPNVNHTITSAMAGGAGKLDFELDALAGSSDRIDVTGTLDIGTGTLGFGDFVFTNIGGVEAGTYVLISATGGITGTLDPADRSGTIGGLTGILQINGNKLDWATDADLDGMPDTFELAHTTPPSATAFKPTDDLEHNGTGDGLTNLMEYLSGTDPRNPDSDGDTLEDGPEVAGAESSPPTDPTKVDTDGDGLNDKSESNTGIWASTSDSGTNPTVVDSDGDGTDHTYAGYGQSPGRWPSGTGPSPFVWYAGKQYDDCLLDEADMGPPAWADATVYPKGCQVRRGGVTYNAAAEHSSSPVTEPGVGGDWSTRWTVHSIFNVTDILDNFATIAFGGWDLAAAGLTVAKGQLAVSGETGRHPEFKGNVKTIEARSYWRTAAESPKNQDFHYNHNAETYMLVGDALGRAMIELQSGGNDDQ